MINMSRRVLDSNIGDNEVDTIMNNIIAQNPQLNAQIETVRNESNVFLCEILRIYPYEDRAYVRILNNNKKVFCRLAHEIMGSNMSIDYVPNGVTEKDEKYYIGKKYIVPFDELYAIVMKVRWMNLDNENVIVGYVNLDDSFDLKTDSDKGEIDIKSGSSNINIDDERISIRTPALFINGLPYNEPELENYYNKNESNIITNSLNEQINNLEERIDNLPSSSGGSSGSIDLSNYVKKEDVIFDVKVESNGHMLFDLDIDGD